MACAENDSPSSETCWLAQVYGWDDETVRETDRELAHLAAAEQDAHAAAAADGDLEVQRLSHTSTPCMQQRRRCSSTV